MKNNRNTFRIGLPAVLAAIVLGLAGCATQTGTQTQGYIFFPPPPDEPHVQYLTSFSSESDLGGGTRFEDFVLGTTLAKQPISKPYGIAAVPGKIYVCDSGASSLAIADLAAAKMNFVSPEGEGQMQVPINLAVDQDGTCYVTDTGRGQVLIYSASNDYLGALGMKGEMKPGGVVVSGGRVYVSDLQNHCVRVYDKAGHGLLFSFPRDPADDKAKLFLPINLGVDQAGHVYVSDTGGFFVKVFDADGNFLRKIGNIGTGYGQFARSKGIAVDREGRIYVVDAATQVVQIFDASGQLLTFLGYPKTSGEAGLLLPAGIALDYDNVGAFQKYAAPGFKLEYLIFVTNQFGGHKVSVFGFGHKE
jgi:DNA-binding beta-propeller fold protein YncE